MYVLLCFNQTLLIQKLFYGGPGPFDHVVNVRIDQWCWMSCVYRSHVRLCYLNDLPSGCIKWTGDIWLLCNSINEGFVMDIWFPIISGWEHVSAVLQLQERLRWLNHMPHVLTTSPRLVKGEWCGYCCGPGEWKWGPKENVCCLASSEDCLGLVLS